MLGLQVGNDIVLRLEFIKERQMKVSALFSSSFLCISCTGGSQC